MDNNIEVKEKEGTMQFAKLKVSQKSKNPFLSFKVDDTWFSHWDKNYHNKFLAMNGKKVKVLYEKKGTFRKAVYLEAI